MDLFGGILSILALLLHSCRDDCQASFTNQFYKAQDNFIDFISYLSICISVINKCIIRGRISKYQFRQIIKYFALDIEASKIAILPKITRPLINKIQLAVREQMATFYENESPFKGDV